MSGRAPTICLTGIVIAMSACSCTVNTAGAPCETDDNCPGGQYCGDQQTCELGSRSGGEDTGESGDAGKPVDAGQKDASGSDVIEHEDAGDAGPGDVGIVDAGSDAGHDAGRDAGPDGGVCADSCSGKGARECTQQGGFHLCDDFNKDGCLEWGTQTACSFGCEAGQCKACAPDCVAKNKKCGDDGCGGSCGVCLTPPPGVCTDGYHQRTYDRPGTCLSDFSCSYASNDAPCSGGCSNNVCVTGTHKAFSRTFSPAAYGVFNAVAVSATTGNLFAAGYAGFDAVNSDGWVVRMKATGDVVWSRRLGGTDGDVFTAIAPTADDGCIAAGSTKSFGAQGKDGWVVRFKAGGEVAWEARYGGLNDDEFRAIAALAGDSFAAAGAVKSWATGREDAWVVRLNGDGSIKWQKYYGSTGDDAANAILARNTGGFLIAGYTDSFGSGYRDWMVFALKDDGSKDWAFATGTPWKDEATAISEGSGGGWIVGGTFQNPDGSSPLDIALLKFNPTGTVTWTVSLGGTGRDELRGLTHFATGAYLAAGSTRSFGAADGEGWVVKVGATGGVEWQKTFGGTGDDALLAAALMPDSDVAIVGTRTGTGIPASPLGWLLTLPPDGSLEGSCPSTFGVNTTAVVGKPAFVTATGIAITVGDSAATKIPTVSTIDPWAPDFADQCTP